MFRKFVERLRESLRKHPISSSNRVRRKVCVPVTISIVPDSTGVRRRDTGKLVMSEETTKAVLSVKGETSDVSESGLAFIVPSVRLGQYYLVGAEGRTLSVVLDLPSGKVCFEAIGRRHEQIGADASATKYLIGAQVTRISEADRRAYNEFVRHGWKAQKSENKGLVFGAPNN
jgi:hypothetical protein